MIKIGIAKYAPLRAWSFVLLGLGLCGWVAAILINQPIGNWLGTPGYNILSDKLLSLIYLAGTPFAAVAVLMVMRQLLFGNGDGVWIANGKLHFLDYHGRLAFSKVPLENIDHLSIKPATAFRPTRVILHLKNGRLSSIPMSLLREPAQTVVARVTPQLH